MLGKHSFRPAFTESAVVGSINDRGVENERHEGEITHLVLSGVCIPTLERGNEACSFTGINR